VGSHGELARGPADANRHLASLRPAQRSLAYDARDGGVQQHNVEPEAIAPVLAEFFAA
jgi:hypothetical protein